MFERFTDDARACVVAATEQARVAADPRVGTIQLMLGVASVDGVSKDALAACGVTEDRLVSVRGRDDGQSIDTPGAVVPEDTAASPGAIQATSGGRRWRTRRGHAQVRPAGGHVPFTPGAKKALELGLREAMRMDSAAIGSGHLLLGLLRGDDADVSRLLGSAGTTSDAVRAEVWRQLGSTGAGHQPARGRGVGLDHLTVDVANLPASKDFYDAVLEPLGLHAALDPSEHVAYAPAGTPDAGPQLWLRSATAAPTHGLHVTFAASDPGSVHAVHDAAVEHGARVLQAPTPAPDDGRSWACVVCDPDGNAVEAIYRHPRGRQ